jgi:hypothetical protein
MDIITKLPLFEIDFLPLFSRLQCTVYYLCTQSTAQPFFFEMGRESR